MGAAVRRPIRCFAHKPAAGLCITIAVLLAAPVLLGRESGLGARVPEDVCGEQFARAVTASSAVGAPYETRLRARLGRSRALFRFHRTPEAIRMLDRGAERLGGSWSQQIPADKRLDAVDALTAFKSCISSAHAPALGTLTVHVFKEDDTRPNGRGDPAGSGAVIRVDGRDVGRTRADGTLSAQVPSGIVEVMGIIPPSSVGYSEKVVRVRPAAETTVDLVLRSGAEPAEETELDLVEAPDDVLLHTATSLTFRFMRDDVFSPITDVEQVALIVDAAHERVELLPEDLFTVRKGAVVATNVRRVFDVLQSHPAEMIGLRVMAIDARGFVHSADVWFRLE